MATNYADLTESEANLLKDVLKIVGDNRKLAKAMAVALKMRLPDFDNLCDSAYLHLGNGRIIAEST